jgi:hypothetical protein
LGADESRKGRQGRKDEGRGGERARLNDKKTFKRHYTNTCELLVLEI